MDVIRRDLRYALRRLLRTPVFTGIAMLSLSVGIGAMAIPIVAGRDFEAADGAGAAPVVVVSAAAAPAG